MSVRWRIYYDDGTTFSDTDGEPWESPVWGACLAIQPALRGNEQLMMNSDWLLWRHDLEQWAQCGDGGLEDQVAHFAFAIGAARKTRWVPGTVHGGTYGEILERARADLKAMLEDG